MYPAAPARPGENSWCYLTLQRIEVDPLIGRTMQDSATDPDHKPWSQHMSSCWQVAMTR